MSSEEKISIWNKKQKFLTRYEIITNSIDSMLHIGRFTDYFPKDSLKFEDKIEKKHKFMNIDKN